MPGGPNDAAEKALVALAQQLKAELDAAGNYFRRGLDHWLRAGEIVARLRPAYVELYGQRADFGGWIKQQTGYSGRTCRLFAQWHRRRDEIIPHRDEINGADDVRAILRGKRPKAKAKPEYQRRFEFGTLPELIEWAKGQPDHGPYVVYRSVSYAKGIGPRWRSGKQAKRATH